MCMCGTPNINGTPNAYSWDGKHRSTRQPSPPDLKDGDELIYDEPGRCGGLDCHSHHFCLVKNRGYYAVLVRHGGGDERFDIGSSGRLLVPSLALMDTNGRYWLMHTLYSTRESANEAATGATAQRWRLAAAEKRIKTRKLRGQGMVKVWIEDKRSIAA